MLTSLKGNELIRNLCILINQFNKLNVKEMKMKKDRKQKFRHRVKADANKMDTKNVEHSPDSEDSRSFFLSH